MRKVVPLLCPPSPFLRIAPSRRLPPGSAHCVSALAATQAHAQEFTLFGGSLTGGGGHGYAWTFDFQEGGGRYAAVGFTWYEEGHIPNGHRDRRPQLFELARRGIDRKSVV